MLGVLVIIKSIWTKELSILAEKIIKIGQQRLKLWPFITPKSVKLSSPKVFMGFFTISTLIFYAWTILVIIISINTCERMILATKIIKIGLLRLKLWYFCLSKTRIFLIQGFYEYSTICNLTIYAWNNLVIMVSIYTCESMILAKKIIKIDPLRLKLEPLEFIINMALVLVSVDQF